MDEEAYPGLGESRPEEDPPVQSRKEKGPDLGKTSWVEVVVSGSPGLEQLVVALQGMVADCSG